MTRREELIIEIESVERKIFHTLSKIQYDRLRNRLIKLKNELKAVEDKDLGR